MDIGVVMNYIVAQVVHRRVKQALVGGSEAGTGSIRSLDTGVAPRPEVAVADRPAYPGLGDLPTGSYLKSLLGDDPSRYYFVNNPWLREQPLADVA
jgi:hypothetical protein